VLLMLFGYVPKLLETGYVVRVELEHAGGLSKGSVARLSGIRIGRITSIELTTAPKVGVMAVIMIDEGIRIPQDVQVKVAAPIFTGSSSLAFNIPAEAEREPSIGMLPTDGSVVLQGEVPELVSEFAGALRTAFEGSVESIKAELVEPLDQFDRIEENFNTLSQHWIEVGQRLEDLLEDRSLDEVDAKQVKGNLTTVLKRMDQRLAQMKDTLTEARQWIKHTTDEVHDTAAEIKSTAGTTAQSVEQLTRRYVALADGLSKAIGDIQKLAFKASQGQGAVGKLLNDPVLYDSLNDSAERIGQAADEFRLLIEKWKAEGLPVQF